MIFRKNREFSKFINIFRFRLPGRHRLVGAGARHPGTAVRPSAAREAAEGGPGRWQTPWGTQASVLIIQTRCKRPQAMLVDPARIFIKLFFFEESRVFEGGEICESAL